MEFLNLTVPNYPYFLYAGSVLYRPGDYHQNRKNTGVFDLVYVERGTLFLTDNDVSYTVSAGEYLILRPTGRHFSHEPTKEQTLFHWIHFVHEGEHNISGKAESIKKGQEQTDGYVRYAISNLNPALRGIKPLFMAEQSNISLRIHGALSQSQQQDFARMHKMLSSAMTSRYDNTYIMHRNSNADIRYQQMFFGILALLQVQPVRDKSNKLADDVMRYLLQNFDRGITLEQMADSLNFHQAYIIRAFKKEYGMTPIEMLNHIRIGKAQQMLENTQMSTAEIAVKVGYSTPSYFARVFKKTVGLTPQAYRNEKKN